MRRGALLVTTLAVVAVLIGFLAQSRDDSSLAPDPADAGAGDVGASEGTGSDDEESAGSEAEESGDGFEERQPIASPEDSRADLNGRTTAVVAAQLSAEPKPEEMPDEHGRVDGTDAPAAEETPQYQNFVRAMENAYTNLTAGMQDCFEQDPSLRRVPLTFTVVVYESPQDAAVEVAGAEIRPTMLDCFARKVNAVDYPQTWDASSFHTERHSVDSQTAAEFTWKFEMIP